MFGSLVVNGTKVVRQISACDALPGFLLVVVPPNDPNTKTKAGDLILKTANMDYFRIHENPAMLDWSECDEEVIVNYADVNLTFAPVKDE